MTTSLLATLVLAAAHPTLTPVGHHDVSVSATSMIVDTTWVLRMAPEPDALFELAAALPRDTLVEGAQPEFGADGRIVALRLSGHASRCVLRSTTPWSTVQEGNALPVPMPRGAGVHRIRIDPDLSFRPDASLGLVTELGLTAPPGFALSERGEIDEVLGIDTPHLGAYYVRGDDVEDAGGLVGEIELRADAQRRTAWVAGGVFVMLCGAAAFEYSRARRRAELERAEALIEAEYAGLEDK